MPIGNRIFPEENKTVSPDKSKKEDPKNKETYFDLSDPKYSLSDIIANPQTLNEIKSLIAFKRDFDKVFNEMGFSSTHKYAKKFIINFYGPPGTGKTITAHAIAKEFGKKLLAVDYSEIESKYVGETPKNIKKIFDFAKDKNCIIFFDEADAILSRRVTNMQNATDTSVNQTRSVFLNILNDFEGDMIFATNFISNYDPAFMRRISKHIYFELPDFNCRKNLFAKYIPLGSHDNVNFNRIAEKSSDLSAADIEKVTLLAAFSACNKGRLNLIDSDIETQIKLVMKSKKENEGTPPSDFKIIKNSPIKKIGKSKP